MIKIDRGAAPVWLIVNRESATAAYIAAPVGAKTSPWRATDIVEALKRDAAGKCMYCEGLIDDVSYAAVEHIRPKDSFPEQVLDWENLGLVCPRCNTNKSNYWSDREEHRLLNPYEDSPSDHLQFLGPIVVAALDSSRAENTLRKLKFHQRVDLIMAKMQKIQDLDDRIRRWHDESESDKKDLLAEDLREAIGPHREFSAALASFAQQQGFTS